MQASGSRAEWILLDEKAENTLNALGEARRRSAMTHQGDELVSRSFELTETENGTTLLKAWVCVCLAGQKPKTIVLLEAECASEELEQQHEIMRDVMSIPPAELFLRARG